MKNLFFASAIAMSATTVNAAEVGGTVKVEVEQNAATDKLETTTTLGLGFVGAGPVFGGFNIESADGGTFEIDEWNLGTVVGPARLSFGDQGGIFVGAFSDFSSVADPSINESLQVGAYNAQVAIGLGDYENDLLDVENVQATYMVDAGILAITTAVDYNFDSEDTTFGTRADGVINPDINAGGIVTYGTDNEMFAYELDAMAFGVVGYFNGDEDDTFQNVGVSYENGFEGLTYTGNLNYNVDTEELTPSVTLALNF